MNEVTIQVPYGFDTGNAYCGAIKGLVNPRTGEFHYIYRWFVSLDEYLEYFEGCKDE